MRKVIGAMALVVTASAHSLQLGETVELAIRNNPEILAKVAEYKAQEQEITKTASSYLPQIKLRAGIGREDSDNSTTRGSVSGDSNELERREASLTLRQLLFDGFGTSHAIQRDNASLEAIKYELDYLSDDIALKAIDAHLEVSKLADVLLFNQENLSAHEKINDQIELRAKSGVDDKAKANQIRARLALAQANIETARNNLLDARADYQNVVGIAAANNLKPGKTLPPLPKSLAQMQEVAMRQNPLLLSGIADVKSARENVAATKGDYYPDVFVETGASWNDNLDGVPGENNDSFIMLRMEYDLFSGGATSSQKKQARFLQGRAQRNVDVNRRKVKRDAEVAWNTYQSALKRVKFLAQYVQSSIETKEAYAKQFNIGQRSLIDLLDTENELLRAKSELADARKELIYSKYLMLQVEGVLLDSLKAAANDS